MDAEILKNLKIVLREKDDPFYTDEELEFYYSKNDGIFKNTVYECLLVKAQNTYLSIPGLSAADSSAYYKKLSKTYKPSNSGILKGAF